MLVMPGFMPRIHGFFPWQRLDPPLPTPAKRGPVHRFCSLDKPR
jgi:hypothetical protein